MNVRLTAHGTAGHASMPHASSAIGTLARALAKLEAAPFPPRMTPTVAAMFTTLTPHMTFPYRLLFANLWITRGLLCSVMCGKSTSAALVRTTSALTLFHAGEKAHTLPGEATANVNHRVLPGSSVAAVLQRDAEVIGDTAVTLTALDAVEPSFTSSHTGPAFQLVARAVEALCPNTVAAPALMLGATDSRWAWGLAEVILRHCPTELQAEEVSMFHGRDEKIGVDNLARIAQFYARVIRDADCALPR